MLFNTNENFIIPEIQEIVDTIIIRERSNGNEKENNKSRLYVISVKLCIITVIRNETLTSITAVA